MVLPKKSKYKRGRVYLCHCLNAEATSFGQERYLAEASGPIGKEANQW